MFSPRARPVRAPRLARATLYALLTACGPSSSVPPATTDAALADVSTVLDAAGSDAAGSDAASVDDDGGSVDVCGERDPFRVFFQDFEGAPVFGTDPHTTFGVPGEAEPRYAVIPAEHMGGRTGHVLRGNMYEYVDGREGDARVADGLAAMYGQTVWGTKVPHVTMDLEGMGIAQFPSTDPTAPPIAPPELYVSLWLWMDADFTFDARWEDDVIRRQSIKLFYAFGPNGIMWVATASGDGPDGGGSFFLNMSGIWDEPTRYYTLPSELGAWHHWELYFQSETRPVYYEYGAFSSHPEWLASSCPDVGDYTMRFPVPGSDPRRCLSGDEALASNSRDGRYVMRVDGVVVQDIRDIALNARFNTFSFPAFHGGGGQAIGTAGWALDDVCVRSRPPQGFVP